MSVVVKRQQARGSRQRIAYQRLPYKPRGGSSISAVLPVQPVHFRAQIIAHLLFPNCPILPTLPSPSIKTTRLPGYAKLPPEYDD